MQDLTSKICYLNSNVRFKYIYIITEYGHSFVVDKTVDSVYIYNDKLHPNSQLDKY